MKEDIAVSICCLVYNHAPYLRKALDSMLMQKTNFKFEILIHDDASTDGSADIIREYEQKYPDIIKPVYQTENQHSQGVKVQAVFNYSRVQGKYFAKCEGDDYWIDENKLQIQFDIMESNPDCSACVHRVDFVDIKGRKISGTMPVYNLSEGLIDAKKILEYSINEHQVLFHTTSFLVKSDVLKEYIQGIEFIKAAPYGDYPGILYYATKGNYYYIEKTMSAYRRCSKNSWTSTQCIPAVRVRTCERLKESMAKFDEYTEGKYATWVQEYNRVMDYNIALANKQYKKLISDEFKDLFMQASKKKKIYTFICWIFPPTDWLYIKFKKVFHLKGF